MKMKSILSTLFFIFTISSFSNLAIAQEEDISIWDSRENCEKILSRMVQNPERDKRVRLGTWNIRFFPLGSPNGPSPKKKTDIEWLACTIAVMEIDVLAVQEILDAPNDTEGQKALKKALKKKTGDDWEMKVDECKGSTGFAKQHVGILYNKKRIEADHLQSIPSLNPTGKMCGANMRPGFGGYFKATFGGGADFHMVSIHLDSGVKARDYSNRKESIGSVGKAFSTLQQRKKDSDVIIVGDWNTMGRSAGGNDPKISPWQEIGELREDIRSQKPGFRPVWASHSCSEYYSGGKSWGLLDHFVVSEKMMEVPKNMQSKVRGYCSLANCGPMGSKLPLSYDKLSDHCPVTLDIVNEDLD